MRLRGRRTIVTVAAFATIAAASAAEVIDPSRFDEARVDVPLPAETPVTAKARCARDMEIVPGGAFLHERGERRPDPALATNGGVPTSAPLQGGDGWRVNAYKGAGDDQRVRVIAICAPKRQLRRAKLVSTHFRIETGNPGGGVSECPQRMRVYSGGALWHEPGEPPDPALAAQLRTSSSAPAPGRRGWYADGYNFTGAELRLEVVAMCLPKRRIGHVTRVLETRTPPNSAGRGARSGCPKGTRVITGGAYWHPPGEFADPAQAAGTLISSSAPVRRGHAWYADGVNFIGPIDYKLTVVAVCAPA